MAITEVLELQFRADTAQVEKATDAADNFAKAADRQRDALGRFVKAGDDAVAAVGKVAVATKRAADVADVATGEIYDFADVYELVEQKANSAATAVVADNQKIAASATGVATATKQVIASVNGVATATPGSGRAILYLAQTLDDAKQFAFGFDQGMRAIGNNIPGVAMALGAGAGLAGTIALVGTVLGVAAPYLTRFVNSLAPEPVKHFSSEIERLKDHIEGLEKKEVKLAIDQFDLDQSKKKLDALIKGREKLNELEGKQNRLEKMAGKAVEESISDTEEGREALERAKVAREEDAVRQAGTNMDPSGLGGMRARVQDLLRQAKEEKAMAAFDPGHAAAHTEEEERLRAAAEEARTQAINKEYEVRGKARDEFGQTAREAIDAPGHKQKAAREKLAKEIAAAGNPEVAREIDRSTPEFFGEFDQDEHNEEIEEAKKAAFKKAKADREAKAKELAGPLMKTMADEAERNGTVDVQRVKDELKRVHGLTDEIAEKYVSDVVKEIQKGLKKAIADVLAEHEDMGDDRTKAAAELAKRNLKKHWDEVKRQADEARADADARDKAAEAPKAAPKTAAETEEEKSIDRVFGPAIGQSQQNAARMGFAPGVADARIQADLKNRILANTQPQFRDPERADLLAQAAVERQRQQIQEQFERRMGQAAIGNVPRPLAPGQAGIRVGRPDHGNRSVGLGPESGGEAGAMVPLLARSLHEQQRTQQAVGQLANIVAQLDARVSRISASNGQIGGFLDQVGRTQLNRP